MKINLFRIIYICNIINYQLVSYRLIAHLRSLTLTSQKGFDSPSLSKVFPIKNLGFVQGTSLFSQYLCFPFTNITNNIIFRNQRATVASLNIQLMVNSFSFELATIERQTDNSSCQVDKLAAISLLLLARLSIPTNCKAM